MAFRNTCPFFLCLITILFASIQSCENCEPDQYGDNVRLKIPVSFGIPSDTLRVGDTIEIQSIFEKEIEVLSSSNAVVLEDFEFFTKFIISEISGTEENYDIDLTLLDEVGQFDTLVSVTARSYPISYVETDTDYQFTGKVVINEPGIYFIGMSCSCNLYEENYEHPFVYQCNDKKRVTLGHIYSNEMTNEEEFETIFRNSPIDYFTTIYDYERYASLGSRCFIVLEP